jgi:hypothetical protein
VFVVRWWPLHRECPEKTYRIYAQLLQLHPSRRETSSSVIPRLQSCKRRTAKKEHNELPRDPLGGSSTISSAHQSCPTQLHCVKTLNTSNHRHCRQIGKVCSTPCSSICHNRKFRKQVSEYSLQVRLTARDTLKVATVVPQ